jgi:predicted Zn-ribbon and HTH transcriptional regulator
VSNASCHPAPGARLRPACELADIVRRYGSAYRSAHRLPLAQLKVLQAIESCRTAALGGHRENCASCGFERFAYNSCRNRHCPKCQTLAKAQWLEERQAELLPVPYFHNVFTLPHELNPLILCHEQNQRALLNLLFQAAAATLLQFGRNCFAPVGSGRILGLS